MANGNRNVLATHGLGVRDIAEKKARLVKQPELYQHSSVRFYITGEHSSYEVISFMALDDIDLTNGKR